NMISDKQKQTDLIAKWFEENMDNAAAVLSLACEKRIALPENLMTAALEMPKPRLLNLLQVFLECGGTAVPIALKLAGHEDPDIRISSLRILARYGLVSKNSSEAQQAEAYVVKALNEEPDDVIEILILQ